MLQESLDTITIYVALLPVRNECFFNEKKFNFHFPGSCLFYFDTSTSLIKTVFESGKLKLNLFFVEKAFARNKGNKVPIVLS